MADAYFDQTVSKERAEALLRQLKAKKDLTRSNSTRTVWTTTNRGEASTETSGTKVRVKLYVGACPC